MFKCLPFYCLLLGLGAGLLSLLEGVLLMLFNFSFQLDAFLFVLKLIFSVDSLTFLI